MPTKLRKLKITRVAVCEQGANYDVESGEGAHILLFKSEPLLEKQDDTPDPTPVTPSSMDPLGTMARRRRRSRTLGKQDFSGPGHSEPDGDESPPLDYATRGQQYELWSCLWDMWERFTCTFYDVVGDCDDDNVPHLPILVASLGQFQADVQGLLDDLGLTAKMAPLFTAFAADLTETARVDKAGAPMAGHRLTRLKDAIASLQQILEECTPKPLERPGVSAADVLGMPYVMKGDAPMALTKNAESDKEHCDNCDDKDCDNAAHDRMKKARAMESRADKADAEVEKLTAQVVKLTEVLKVTEDALAKTQTELTTVQEEAAIAKMSPEEQRDTLLASMPELVRKSYLDQESRLALIEKANQDLHAKSERMDYIQKAAQLRPLGFNPDDHWEILKAIDLMPEGPRDELLRLLKAATEQTRTAALWTTAGSQVTSPTGSDGSAEAQILALAQAHQTEKGGTLGDAIGHVAKSHPDLWARDQQEKRFKNRVESR